MTNLLHFLHSPGFRVASVVVFLELVLYLYVASDGGRELIYYLADTFSGWFGTKTPDDRSSKAPPVTDADIVSHRHPTVDRNYPAKTPDTDSFLETAETQEFHRWIVLLWYGRACSIPPFGWFCTRGKGHPGPCAARLVPDSILNRDTSAQNSRSTRVPAALGAPYDFSFSLAADAFFGAPPSVNDTVAAPPEPSYRTFVLNKDAFVDPKTCGCTACKDFRNRVFKTDPGALGAPYDEFAARAWQALSKLRQDEEQAVDAFRARQQNQKFCKHPKGFSLGLCPICLLPGDSLK